MTRQEWLNQFDAEVTRASASKFDLLIERCIAAGGTTNDLDALAELWRAEVDARLPPLRARAVRLLDALSDEEIVWD
jgi:hypothetical protein